MNLIATNRRHVTSQSLAKKKVSRVDSRGHGRSHAHFRWGRLVKWVAIPILTVFLLAFAAGSLLFVSYAATAPKLNINKLESQPNTVIYDSNDHVVAQLGAEQRVNVKTKDIPMNIVNALTSIEDHRFFNHRGVDPIRIAGSLLHNSRNDTTQGGSTLTQELIKLSFFSTSAKDRTLKRKAQEAWMSIELEKKMSKEEILTLYINKVYMSNGYYGMETAAKNFYQKPLSQLSIAQSALLAGMPQAPNDYDPYTNPVAAKQRRDLVIQAMYRYGKITAAEEKTALATAINDGLKPLPTKSSIPLPLNNYITEVLNQIKTKTGKDPMTTSMKIYTPLDEKMQDRLYDIFNTDQYVNYPNDKFQVASTIVDVNTGAVVAQLGGRKQLADSVLGTNQAVNTDRDWGSSMKPITDYGPAIDDGIYTSTAQPILDAPYNFPGTTDPVVNWDHKFMGTITMRVALEQSRNVTATKTLEAVGLENSSNFLKKLGIVYPQEVWSNAFSSNTSESGNQYGASSEKMAAAYAAFANGGDYTQPYYVNKIVYSDGVSMDMKPKTERVMKPTTAFMMTDMLKGVIPRGTNGPTFPPNKLTQEGLKQAGKTGTTNYTDEQLVEATGNSGMYGGDPADGISMMPDELFVGYTKKYSMATWTGYSNRLVPLNYQDSMIASDVYTQMMSYLYPDPAASEDWTMPDGLYKAGSEYYLNGAKTVTSPSISSSVPVQSSPVGNLTPATSSSTVSNSSVKENSSSSSKASESASSVAGSSSSSQSTESSSSTKAS